MEIGGDKSQDSKVWRAQPMPPKINPKRRKLFQLLDSDPSPEILGLAKSAGIDVRTAHRWISERFIATRDDQKTTSDGSPSRKGAPTLEERAETLGTAYRAAKGDSRSLATLDRAIRDLQEEIDAKTQARGMVSDIPLADLPGHIQESLTYIKEALYPPRASKATTLSPAPHLDVAGQGDDPLEQALATNKDTPDTQPEHPPGGPPEDGAHRS